MVEQYLPPLSEAAKRWLRFGALLAACAALFWVARSLADVLWPIAFSLALAYVFNPVVTWFEKRGVERVSSIAIGLIAALGTAAILLTIGFVQVITFVQQTPYYFDQAARWLDDMAPTLVQWKLLPPEEPAASQPGAATSSASLPASAPTPAAADGADVDVVDATGEEEQAAPAAVVRPRRASRVMGSMMAEYVRKQGPNLAYAAYLSAPLALDRVTYWLTVAALIPIYTFFFLLRFDRVVNSIRDHLPQEYRPTIVRIASTIDRSMSDFFRGRVVICMLVGLLSAVGWLVVGVPYSLPLGALAGVLNLVPFVGVLVLPPVLVLTFLESPEGAWLFPVSAAFAVFLLVQAIESFVLTPYIHGQSSGLHPVTTVVALLIGQAWAGALGMLLAIPIASALKLLALEFIMPEIRRLAGHPPAPAPPPGSPPESTAPTPAAPATPPQGEST